MAWFSVIVRLDLLRSPPLGSLSVFKLAGVVARDDFVASTATCISRRATWRHAVKGSSALSNQRVDLAGCRIFAALAVREPCHDRQDQQANTQTPLRRSGT